MTATLPPAIKFQPLVGGAPLPGGKVKFYLAGTTTPQTVYAADGVTPIGSELILDANGATDFRLDPTLAYKIDLLDAYDLPQLNWPVDNIKTLDAGFISYDPAGSYADGTVGAALSNMYTTIIGDGVTDVSAQVTAANALGYPIRFKGVAVCSGVTITVPILDTINQIFSIGSTVTINNGLPVRPEWWGNGQNTIQMAHDALPATGGTIKLRAVTYQPNNHAYDSGRYISKPNIKIQGEKMPVLATDCKSLVNGTVIQGMFLVFADNFEMTDCGVDDGYTVVNTYNGGTVVAGSWGEGLELTFATAAQKTAGTLKYKARLHNVIGLAPSPSATVHAVIVAEGYRGVVCTGDIVGCYGVHGVVIKATDVKAESLTAYCNGTEGVIIKSESAAATASDVHIGRVYARAAGPVGLSPYIVPDGNSAYGLLFLTGASQNIDDIQIGQVVSIGYVLGVHTSLGATSQLLRVQIGSVHADCTGVTAVSAGVNISALSGVTIDMVSIDSVVVANATKGVQVLYYGTGLVSIGSVMAYNITDVVANMGWQATLSLGRVTARTTGGVFRISGSGTLLLGSYITNPISPSGGTLFVTTNDDAGLTGLAPALANGWTQYASNDVFGVQLNGGRVSLQGLIKPGTTNVAATLPFWCRPRKAKRFVVQGSNGTVSAVPVTIDTSGNVTVNEVAGGTANCTTWLSLSGINFTLLD